MAVHLVLVLLASGCSDYRLAQQDGVSAPGTPDIRVSPESLDVVACGETASQVQVSNVGDGTLTVSAATVQGEGWALSSSLSSFSLEPDKTEDLDLVGTEGEATLVVTSDDPDEPRVEVPLVATADQPPEVTISWPTEGEILPSGEAVTLEGEVWDDVDEPEALAITWSSSEAGEIATVTADDDGLVTSDWTAASRPGGNQDLTLAAVDSCGLSGDDTVSVCQQAGYSVDELEIENWESSGSASFDEDEGQLQLTPADTWQVGTAFATHEQVSGDAVDIAFRFYIGGGTGADGFSLTLLDADAMTTYEGGGGCGMGYGEASCCNDGPALPGWSLEVDTYYNECVDGTEEDHLAFVFDGDLANPAVEVTLPDMEDATWHDMTVVVDAPQVTVTIDETVYIDQELSGDFSFSGWVGFTAGTGDLTNEHLVESLEVTDYACEE